MTCPFCKKEIVDGAFYCPKCGNRLPSRSTSNTAPTKIIIAIVALFLGVFLITATFLHQRIVCHEIEHVMEGWKSQAPGTIEGDYREVPDSIIESNDEELKKIVRSYNGHALQGNNERDSEGIDSDIHASKEDEDIILINSKESSDNAHGEVPGLTGDDSINHEKYEHSIYNAIKDKIVISYKKPILCWYPLKANVTIESPSLVSIFQKLNDEPMQTVDDIREAIIRKLDEGDYDTMITNQTVTFYKTDDYVYCKRNEAVANALTGGLGDLIGIIARQKGAE